MSVVGWLLLLVVLAAAGAVAARRLRLPASSPRPAVRSGEAADDLASLGLSEARPASARPTAPPPSDARPGAAGDGAREPAAHRPTGRTPSGREPSVLMPPASPAETLDIEPRPGGVRLGHDSPWNGRAVPLLLGSMSAHTRGHVAVVRRDGDGYAVVARTDGGPLAPIAADALPPGGGPCDVDALGALATLTGGPARAVPLGSHVVLVGGEGAAADRYLDLLAALTPGATPSDVRGGSAGRPSATDDAASHDGAAGYDDRQPDAAPVPRAVLIENEQDAARAEGQPLAFALVTLADAEDRLTQDPPEEVAAAEAALRTRLEAAEGVRRVEPFGDLLFGAFVERDPDGMAAWCDALAAGEPPLFIGAVAPADGAAADIRDAAAEALRDAYDRRGTAVVVA